MMPTYFVSDFAIDLLQSPSGISACEFRHLIQCFKARAVAKAEAKASAAGMQQSV
jgi:hypothetical protein